MKSWYLVILLLYYISFPSKTCKKSKYKLAHYLKDLDEKCGGPWGAMGTCKHDHFCYRMCVKNDKFLNDRCNEHFLSQAEGWCVSAAEKEELEEQGIYYCRINEVQGDPIGRRLNFVDFDLVVLMCTLMFQTIQLKMISKGSTRAPTGCAGCPGAPPLLLNPLLLLLLRTRCISSSTCQISRGDKQEISRNKAFIKFTTV